MPYWQHFTFLAAAAVLIIIAAVTMKREKKLLGFYRAVGLFDRGYAVITLLLLVAGFAIAVAAVLLLLLTEREQTEILIFFGVGFLLLVVGIVLVERLRAKCAGKLRRRLTKDLLLCGCGGFFRVALFLVGLLYPAWWDAKHPEEFILDDGDSVYALPGSRSLYNDRARRVAVANEAMTKAIPVERIG